MYAGNYQLGDLYPLQVLCTASDASVLPDDAPRAVVYDNTGVVESTLMPVTDSRNTTGRFHFLVNLDGKYSVGYHWVLYQYYVSSTLHTKLESFEIVAGGDVNGSGISMEYFRRPPNDYVLVQSDTGVLYRRKNPEVAT